MEQEEERLRTLYGTISGIKDKYKQVLEDPLTYNDKDYKTRIDNSISELLAVKEAAYIVVGRDGNHTNPVILSMFLYVNGEVNSAIDYMGSLSRTS